MLVINITIFQVQECVDKYARIFVFSVENMRNSKLKDVRNEWKHSRYNRMEIKINTEYTTKRAQVATNLLRSCNRLVIKKPISGCICDWFATVC